MSEYLHPSISSKIIDRSQVFVSAQGLTNLFAVFTSDRGEDNVLQYVTSPSEFIFKYGEPNFTKHGQMAINIIEWLKTSGGAWVLRVTPDDATYSHGIIGVNVVDNDGINEVTPFVRSIPLAVSKATLALYLSANADGADFPLMAIVPKGRGKSYNDLAYRLTVNDNFDETFDFRVYDFEVIERLDNGAEQLVEGPYQVSLTPDALGLSRESMFIADVLGKYSDRFEVIFDEENYDDLADALDINPDLADLLFGSQLKRSGALVPNGFDFVAGDDLSQITYMQEGSDGFIVPANGGSEPVDRPMTRVERIAAEKALLIKGYTGITDPKLTDKKQVEIDMILDGNQDVDVKNAMADLAKDIRKDFMTIVDCGFTGSYSQAVDFRQNQFTVNSPFVAIFAQDAVVYDEYTGRDIKVTSPYFLASKIPSVDEEFGIHWPFVGPRRGSISGQKSVSWFPTEPQKEQLYKAQINYIEQDPRRTKFGSQLTSQVTVSALSNISIMRALLRIQRDIEKLSEDYPFEFNDAETYDSFQYSLNSYVDKWVKNRACEYITATVYASEYDKQSKIARVKVEMKFTSIIERIFIDLIVNR